MPRPRSQSRRQIVDTARTLLHRQGYQGTGLAQIIGVSGAPRGSVYFLFPGGKEEIAVAAIAASTTEFEQLIDTAFECTGSLSACIQWMARHFAATLADTGFREGCPVATVTLDSAPDSAALSAACRTAYETWNAALSAGLIRYGVPAADARDLAMFVLTSLEGAMLLCRAYQSTGPLDIAERQVLAALAPYAR